eukprot:Em0003g982a
MKIDFGVLPLLLADVTRHSTPRGSNSRSLIFTLSVMEIQQCKVKSTFPARIAPFAVFEPLPLGLIKARFERETWTYFALLYLHNGRGSYLDFEPLGVLCLVTSARSKDDGLLVGEVAKKGSTRRHVSVLSSWMEAWNKLHSNCAQTALELVKYQHIICQLFAPDGSSLEFQAGSPPHQQALLHHLVHMERATHNAGQKVLGPRLWWRALPQGLAMCCTSGPVISSEFTPLYDQSSHITL